MKKLLIFFLIIISVQSFGQYNYINAFYRWRGGMFDSSLHIPRYNGTPSGLRTGSSVQDGAIAMDTTNNIFYIYSGGAWIAQTGNNIYNSNGILSGNRTLTGLNNARSLTFDSLDYFSVNRAGSVRMYMSSTMSSLYSPNGTNSLVVDNTGVKSTYNGGVNYFYVRQDSSLFHNRASYEGNIHGTFYPYSLVDKSYVDSVSGAGANFANTDLTFTGNRVHNANANSLTIQNLNTFDIYTSNGGTRKFHLSSSGSENGRILSTYDDYNYKYSVIDFFSGASAGSSLIDMVSANNTFGQNHEIRLYDTSLNILTNTSELKIYAPQLPNLPTDKVLYYNTGDGKITYGDPSGGSTSRFGVFGEDDNIQENRQPNFHGTYEMYFDSTKNFIVQGKYSSGYIFDVQDYITNAERIKVTNNQTFIASADGNTVTAHDGKVWFDINVTGSTDSLGATVLPYNSSPRLVHLAQDSVTGRWYRQTVGSGAGTVTSFSFTDANGFTGSVANSTTTPALTLNIGNPSFEDWYSLKDDFKQSIYDGFLLGSNGTASSVAAMTTSDIIDGWMYGIVLNTGTSTTGNAYFLSSSGGASPVAPIISINSSVRFNAGSKIRLEDLSDGTDTYEAFFGFMEIVTESSSIVDGVYFRYTNADSSGKWIACTESNNTKTEVQTSVTVAADTDYELAISVFNGHAYFWIASGLSGSLTLVADITTNIPSGTSRATAGPEGMIRKTAGTNNRKMYGDWAAYGTRKN